MKYFFRFSKHQCFNDQSFLELQSEYDELKKNYETLINELGSMHQQLKTSKTQNEELENKLKQEIKKNGDLTNQLQSSNRVIPKSFKISILKKKHV